MRTFCITLPETPERTQKAKTHFQERGVNVEFFNGINAEVAGLATVHTYEVDNPGTGFRIGYKPTGIWLSHYMLWAALNMQPDPNFFVLEVDAKFADNWPYRFQTALENVPKDFDMLFIGSCCCQGARKKQIAGEVWEVKYPTCFHAYIISKKALPIMLSMRKVWAPIDLQGQFEVYQHLKIYAVLPRIVEQFDTIIPA